MVGVLQPHEGGAAGHHVFLVEIGDPEPEDVDVKTNGLLHIGDEQGHVAEFTELKRHSVRTFQEGDDNGTVSDALNRL